MCFVVVSLHLQPEICPGVGDLSLSSVVLATSFTARVCKEQKHSLWCCLLVGQMSSFIH